VAEANDQIFFKQLDIGPYDQAVCDRGDMLANKNSTDSGYSIMDDILQELLVSILYQIVQRSVRESLNSSN
jgi:hypothetical protein